MGGQLDGNFLPGSLPHKFILTVTLIIWFVVNIFFLSLQRHGAKTTRSILFHPVVIGSLLMNSEVATWAGTMGHSR